MSYTPPDPYIFEVTGGYSPPDPFVLEVDASGETVYIPLLAEVAQPWHLTESVAQILEQSWALRLGADLRQVWSDAATVQGVLSQPWSDAGVLVASLVQRWRDMVLLQYPLSQPWAITGAIQAGLIQPWTITVEPIKSGLVQRWDLRDLEQVAAIIRQPWAIAGDGAVLRYSVEVLADGVAVGINALTIEGGLDQDVLTATLELASEVDYLRCPFGAVLEITITSQEGVDMFAMVVITPAINQAWGDTRFTVEAMSPAALLGEPYASGMEGELSGLASTIAATLAGTIPLTWQTVDWTIPSGTWTAATETPLALLKTLAASVGAVVQSQPDGGLTVLPKAFLPATQWAAAVPDVELVEILDCFSTGTTPEHRSGYNRFVISSQSTTTTDGLRLEAAVITEAMQEVRGYQVPWVGGFDLDHTGGSWVSIEPMGVEERSITEVVEIVAGGGSCQYPQYAITATEWLQIDLGAIDVAEDGTITAAVAAESLLQLTYTTRCQLWRVRDAATEQLQLVIP